ncbi:2-hexaprenyl-6-methoxy-1,4-benzoquinone methyltransferase [Agyrium rufum]|nr:2-hexaprenyl-6-methoxy-1,4-benzoquinone methyltransferase [Agyrium rufum]
MASKRVCSSFRCLRQPNTHLNPSSSRAFSSSTIHRQQPQEPRSQPQHDRTTHFGFETIPASEKESKVGAVFSSVASSYDTMNDLMSLGIHRLWKDHFVRSLSPGISPIPSPSPATQPPYKILDVAGGTGDIAFRLLDHSTQIKNDTTCSVTVSDINSAMLNEGRRRSLTTAYAHSPRLSFLEANAENLSAVESNSLDLYTVAFGIRNFTDKPAALREAYRVLKPGGVFACLEFSKVARGSGGDGGGGGNLPFPLSSMLDAVYKRWSFGAIPLIGQLVAADRASYQYLVESIERFPSQGEFCDMIADAGFLIPGGRSEGGGWESLTGGIAAVHKGVKPKEGSI